MGNIISIAFFLFIVITIISKSNKKMQNEKTSTTQNIQKYEAALARGNIKPQTVPKAVAVPTSRQQVRTINPKTVAPVYSANNHSHKSASEAIGNKLMDDRNNDWLANQLREEHRAFKRTSEMFELKIEHVSHCDARYIEQFHHRYCDANKIDTARGH